MGKSSLKRASWILTALLVLFAGLALLFGCADATVTEKRTVTFMNGEEVFAVQEVELGQKYSFPEETPTREQPDDEHLSKFVGWTLDPNYYEYRSEILSEPDYVSTDLTVYAAFRTQLIASDANEGADLEYRVEFRMPRGEDFGSYSGQTLEQFSQVVKRYTSAVLPDESEMPEITGYHFTGNWTGGTLTDIRGHRRVTAVYEKNVYRYVWHYLDETKEREVEFREAIDLTEMPEVESAFVFDGWYTDEARTQRATMNEAPAYDLHLYAKYHIDFSTATVSKEGTMVYGDASNQLFISGLNESEGIVYTYRWTVNGVQGSVTSDSVYPVKDAGNYRVSVEIFANYKNGVLEDKANAKNGSSTEFNYPVEKATLSAVVTLSTSSITYGDTAPTASVEYTGFKFNETREGVGVTQDFVYKKGDTDVTGQNLHAGTYRVETVPHVLSNYQFAAIEAPEFTVEKKDLTVTVEVDDYTYGDDFAPEISFEGFEFSDGEAELGEHWFTIDGEEKHYVGGERVNAGAHAAKLFGYASDDYNTILPSVDAAFSVAKRDASVALHAEGGVYGVEPKFTYTFTNVLEDDYSAFTPNYTYKRSGNPYTQKHFIVGSYDLDATFTEAGSNYNPLTVTGAQFEITKKPLAVSVSVESSYIYGDTIAPVAVYEEAFVFEDSAASSITGTLSYVYRTASTEQQYYPNRKAVGNYTVEVSGLSSANYELSFPKSNFQVTKKALTLTVHLANASILYGSQPAAAVGEGYTNGISYDGLLADETITQVFGTNPTIVYRNGVGTKTTDFHAGEYTATVEVDPQNYDVTVKTAKLTVNKRTLFVGINYANASLVYGKKPTANIVYTKQDYDGFFASEQSLYTAKADIQYEGAETYKQSTLGGNSVKMIVGEYALSVIGLEEGVLADYIVTYQHDEEELTFSITQKELTVTLTADRNEYTYGEKPSVQVAFSGFEYGESEALFGESASDVLYVSAAKTTIHASDEGHIGAGRYTATLEGIVNANYTVKLNAASFTVNKKALRVTVSANGFTYGDKDTPEPKLSYNGFVSDENEDVLEGDAVYTYTKGDKTYSSEHFDAGSYTVAVEGFTSDNYQITFVSGSFNVAKRDATVTLKTAGATYGGTPTYSYESDILPRDVASFGFGYALTFSRTNNNYTAYTPANYKYYQAGNYRVQLTFTQNDNYNAITVSTRTFTVARKVLTVGVEGMQERYTYGDTLSPKLTFIGFVDGETESVEGVFSSKPNRFFTYTTSSDMTTSGEKLAVGNYFIAAVQGYTANNYTVQYAAKTAFEVTKKVLTVTVTAQDITYGEKPAPKLAFDGFVYEEGESALQGKANYTYTGETKNDLLRAGEHNVSVDGFTSSNYDITFVGGSFNVWKRDLTVNVEVGDIVYGAAPAPVVTYEGFISGEGAEDLEGELTYSYTGEKSKSGFYRVGEHALTLDGYSSKDYAITYRETSFEVSPREVTVTFSTPWTTYADPQDTKDFVWYTVSKNILEDELTFTASFTRGGSAYTLGSDTYLPFGQYILTLSYEKNADYTVKEGGKTLDGTATKNFEIAKRTLSVSVTGSTPWADREKWHGAPKLNDNRFTLEGQLVLANAESVDATTYTEDKVGGTFVWQNNSYKIMLDGKDVTENFDLAYSIALTLDSSSFQVVVPEGKFTYDSKEHPFPITATASGVDAADIEITYKTSEEGDYAKTVPTFTDAGEYTVYYKVTAPNCEPKEDSYKVSGAKATPTLVAFEDSGSYTYNKENNAQVDTEKVRAQVVKNNVYDDATVEYQITFNGAAGSFTATLGEVKNAGSYTITVKVSGKNYNEQSATYTLTIGKATVNAPDITHATYNGGNQKATVAEDERYTVKTNDGGTNADRYDVVLELTDAANYKWTESEGATLTLQFVIDKAKLEKPSADGTSFTYTSEVQTYNPVGFDSKTMTVNGNKQTAAGDHSVTVTITDTANYEWQEGEAAAVEFTFRIAKADYIISGVVDATGYTYNATEQGRTLDELKALIKACGEDAFTVEFVGASTAKNAGTTTVTYKVSGNDNYNDKTSTYQLTIDKATPNVTFAEGEYTYNTENQGLKIQENFELGEKAHIYGDDATIEYAVEKLSPAAVALAAELVWSKDFPEIKNAGTYKIYVKVSGDNYEETTKDFEVTIDKAQGTIDVSKVEGTEYTYNGAEQTVELKNIEHVGDGEFTVESFSFKNVADGNGHEIKITLGEGENYLGTTETVTITVNKATPTLNKVDDTASYTFSGSQQIDAAKIKGAVVKSNVYGDETVEYQINGGEFSASLGEVKNAGSYTITVKVSGDNYNEVTNTYTLTVQRAQYNVTANDQAHTYNGTAQGNAITVGGVKGDREFSAPAVLYNGEASVAQYKDFKVGGYTVNFTVPATTNYAEKTGSYTITINKATLRLNENAPTSVTGTYDKHNYFKEITKEMVDGLCGDDSIDVKYSRTQGNYESATLTFINVSENGTVYFEVSAGENYESVQGSYAVTIAAREVTVTLPENITGTYNGTPHGADLAVTLVAEEGNTALNEEAAANATVKYDVSGHSDLTKDTLVNANVYTINVTIDFDSNGNFTYEKNPGQYTVTIDKATPNLVDYTDSTGYVYDKSSQLDAETVKNAVVKGNVYGDETVEYQITFKGAEVGGFSATLGEIKNAGSYTITVKVSGANYNEVTKTYTLTIAMATPTLDGVDTKIEEQVNKLGKTLKDVNAPAGFHWSSVETPLTLGAHEYNAYYNPDSDNYNDLSTTLTFTTRRENITITAPSAAIEFKFGEASDKALLEKFEIKGEGGRTLSAEELALITKTITEIDYTVGSTYLPAIKFTAENNYFVILEGGTEFDEVLVKIKSVWIGSGTIGEYANQDLYTIEDALHLATSGQIVVVEYNTSFAIEQVAAKAGYPDLSNAYTVVGTLLVPYGKAADGYKLTTGQNLSMTNASSRADIGIAKQQSGNPVRTGGYATLTVPENIKLSVSGKITVNAILVAVDGPSAYILGANYGELVLGKNAEITFNNNSEFDGIGFVTGEGTINVKEGVTVYEPLNATGFKGFNGTQGAGVDTFPINQFTLSSIAVEMKIAYGVKYNVLCYIVLTKAGTTAGWGVSAAFAGKSATGKEKAPFMQMGAGSTITKKVNPENGKVKFAFNGDVTLNNLDIDKISLVGITLNLQTSGFQIPLAGHFELEVQTGTLTVSKGVELKLLPGATLIVRNGATLDVQGAIYAYGNNVVFPEGYNQFSDGKAYPTNGVGGTAEAYRTNVTLGYNATTPADFRVEGTLKASADSKLGAVISGAEGATFEVSTTNLRHVTITEDDTLTTNPNPYIVEFSSTGLNQDKSSTPFAKGTWHYTAGYWKGEYYQIIYEANGGELRGETSDVYSPAAITEDTIQTTDPERNYHTFTGWYYDQSCTQKVGEYPHDMPKSGDVLTVYAGWKTIKYTVKFDVTYLSEFDNSSIQIPTGVTWSYGESVKLDDPTWDATALSELVFSGWCINSNFTDPVTEINNDNIDLITIDKEEIIVHGSFRMGSEFSVIFMDEIELYAEENEAEHKLNSLYAHGELRNDLVGEIGKSVSEIADAANTLKAIDNNQHEYYFGGWYTMPNGEGLSVDANTSITADYLTDGNLVLYANWIRKAQIKVTLWSNYSPDQTYADIVAADDSFTVKTSEKDYQYFYYYYPKDTSVKITIHVRDGNMGRSQPSGHLKVAGTTIDTINNVSQNEKVYNISMPDPVAGIVDLELHGNGLSCIVEGTLVMLADGTQKKVEDLQVGDMVLVFNHETGKYEAAPLLFNTHEGSDSIDTTVVFVMFADGSELGIVGEHALFDVDLNRYVFLNAMNANDYIGHRFVKVVNTEGGFVSDTLTMTGVRIEQKCVKYYSPVSLFHLNVVTNDLLSYTAFVQNSEGFVNYFEYEEGSMKYDEAKMQADIEKYGLYTYEDFKDVMSEELFAVGPWKYFKIAVGKGQLTWDDIMAELDFILHSGEVDPL